MIIQRIQHKYLGRRYYGYDDLIGEKLYEDLFSARQGNNIGSGKTMIEAIENCTGFKRKKVSLFKRLTT